MPLHVSSAHRRLLLVLACGLLAGCATVSSQPRAQPRLVRSLFVTAAPGWFQDRKTGSTAMTFMVHDLVQSLADQVSRRLNEGGNNTSTSLVPGATGSAQALVRDRQRATGITEALVISVKQLRMSGAIPVSIELEAKLHDAASMEVLWDYSFAGKVDGRAVPEIAQSVIAALRKDGFVR